ncbi:hypothetical protein D3C85_710850 [compost metagenome]
MAYKGRLSGAGITGQQHANWFTMKLLVITKAVEIILNSAKQRRLDIAVDKGFELIDIRAG